MLQNFSEFGFWVYTAACENAFIVLFWIMIAFVCVVLIFVFTELRNYDIVRGVPTAAKQARERYEMLKARIAKARANGSPAFDYGWGERLLYAVTLCLDDADRKVARDPSHVRNYKAAWKDVTLARSQLDNVELLFTYVPSEG